MLTDAQKTDVRRHCGYPMFGNQATQGFGYRFMTHYGTLEYRMNHASDAEEAIVIHHLAQLETLEDAIVSTGLNLDTAKAAIWERNPHELRERMGLYQARQIDLCNFFGVPPGPGISSGSDIVI